MPKTIEFKDVSGTIQSFTIDTDYPIKVTVSADTEWQTITVDGVNPILTTDWVGNIPRPKK